MFGLSIKSIGQNNPADEGKFDIVDGICHGLDRVYPDWKSPSKTHMVPTPLLSHRSDKGAIAEKDIYDLLHRFGTQRKEPMFVVHSSLFNEHIPDSGRQKSWVMGEVDFLLIHKIYGPIFIEVKATDTGKTHNEAAKQLLKDKLALQIRLEKAVEGKFSKRMVKELFTSFPAFVAMPNCPRPDGLIAHDNALYQEDCSSLEGFDEWWEKKVGTARHSVVSSEMYECLVIRYATLLPLFLIFSCILLLVGFSRSSGSWQKLPN